MSKDQDDDLIRRSENLDAAHLTVEETRDAHDFGNWPDLVGAAFTPVVIWYSFAFTG